MECSRLVDGYLDTLGQGVPPYVKGKNHSSRKASGDSASQSNKLTRFSA